jgi:LysM repeat protein
MVQATRIAAVLIAACLSGCGGLTTGFDPNSTASSAGSRRTGDAALLAVTDDAAAKAGSAAAPSPRPSPAPGNSLSARAAVETKPLDAAPAPTPVAAKSGETPKPVEASVRTDSQVNQPRGRAYLFRGVAGLIYSTGIDRLADRISHAGLTASVDTYLVWPGVAAEAIREYRRSPFPIVLIGHSFGGDAAVGFAETLNNAGIPVSLLVTYDPTRIADAVPPNVERYINIYQSWNVMGGGDVVGGRGFHGHYASVNLADHGEIIHINIEKAEDIQEQLVAKIVQLTRTPTAGQGEVVPIRYAVPARAPIELWDSGVPVKAQAGDTLQSLASAHHVPVWALAQINRMPEQATFAGGERIIVPRNLAPTGAPAALSYASTNR